MPVAIILYSESWDRAGVSLPCQELAAEGIVVVTVSYRLHLLGFFTLRSLMARGNLALLDQYLAFLWVRDNIAAFGGDPSTIVLIGHSAGADSILHHIVSPRAAGLFQRAILMSPRDIWKAVDENKTVNSTEVEELSRKVAQSLGCSSNIDQEILHCMRERPLANIVSLYSNANWSKILQLIPDDFLPTSEQYLPVSLAAALSASNQPTLQLDVLFGTTDLEDVNHNDQNDALPMLAHAVRWEFWGTKGRKDIERGTFETVEGLARMESSAKWGVGSALLAARLARKISRLYVYRYLQPGNVDLRGNHLNFTGAVHGVDLIALLGDALMLQVARQPSDQDQKRITSLFRQYIINFIKFGSPVPENNWKRYKFGDAYVHGIHNDENNINTNNVNKDATFWLQYLQQLNSYFSTSIHTEQLTSQKGKL
ncbi:unnamed protein product [Diatraea saccharalis]|uniref:Carboxylic ester hydrolase n=1 Tax=Diatraea saccharalis TaxID=40085 RepID=A0A9N9RH93_9NEOP|nr:unnamed protein product [Diatraea saccharalis]